MTESAPISNRKPDTTTLWCVNIHGPDDIIAFPDYLSTVRAANAFNAWWLELKTKQPLDVNDPWMWAVPVKWPHDDASHAASLANPSDEYQWLLSAARRDASREGEAVAQLGGAPDDLHNLIKVVFADCSIERINEVCREVLSRRDPSKVHPTPASVAQEGAIAREPEAVERVRLHLDTREAHQSAQLNVSTSGLRAVFDYIDALTLAPVSEAVGDWLPIGEEGPQPPHDKPVLLWSPPSLSHPDGLIEARPFSTGRQGDGWSEYSQQSWATYWRPLPASPASIELLDRAGGEAENSVGEGYFP